MIRILSIFWMFAIVLYHASFSIDLEWYNELMSDCRMGGVGFFFAVSGYFLMKRYGMTSLIVWWKDEVRKRIFSVLVPYLIWCSIGFGIHCMMNGFSDAFNPKAITDAFGLTSLVPLANPPLWYLKFLFLFVLISPAVLLVARNRLVGGVLLALGAIAFPVFPLRGSFSFFFSVICFASGMYFALWGKEFTFARMGAIFLTVGLVLLIPLYQSSSTPFRMYRAYLLIGVSFGGGELLVRYIGKILVALPTFFLFCAHAILIKLMPIAHSPFWALILTTSIFASSIGMAILLKRAVPRVYAFLTAGR